MGNCFGEQRMKAEASSAQNLLGRDRPSSGSSPRKQRTAGSQDSVLHHAKNGRELSPPCTPVRVATLRSFPFANLQRATRKFCADSRLGEGGCMFKGYVDEQTFLPVKAGRGMVIAVKKLNLEGLHGHKEWLAEVQFLGGLHHPNLVKLLGFCAEKNHRLLVYEFMPRGSLENHLFRKGSQNRTLSWATRMKIATSTARGLTFLHDAQKPVIYRNLRASSILLDTDYNAKLSDFGLAKDGPTGDDTHVSTRAMGVAGYVAPEYTATGHLTAKSDVYSFGVVLLELLTGRRVVDRTLPRAKQDLLEWARPFLTDRHTALEIMDQTLASRYPPKGALKAVHIAQNCLSLEGKARPNMREVLEILEELVEETPSSSQVQGSTGPQLKGFTPPPSPTPVQSPRKHM